jgi:hypothetical protein
MLNRNLNPHAGDATVPVKVLIVMAIAIVLLALMRPKPAHGMQVSPTFCGTIQKVEHIVIPNKSPWDLKISFTNGAPPIMKSVVRPALETGKTYQIRTRTDTAHVLYFFSAQLVPRCRTSVSLTSA